MKTKRHIKTTLVLTSLLSVFIFPTLIPQSVNASNHEESGKVCGSPGEGRTVTAVGIGCKGVGNPIGDMLAAFVRFLAAGVGLVITLSIIVAGIQYIASSGDPQGLAAAKGRLANAIIALLLFIFMSAILHFLIPGGIVII